MMFSIIMQSRMGIDFEVEKLHRAINSVLGQQTKSMFEIIIIADSCQRTWDEVINNYQQEFYSRQPRVRLYLSPYDHTQPRKIYSYARNHGLKVAKGRWVLYLDNDDYYTNDYLENLSKLLDPINDWYTVDDLVWNKTEWKVRRCNFKMGSCGTANIVHKSSMLSRWPNIASYGRDDWMFLNNLKHESTKFKQLDIAGYCVCRIPNRYII